MRTPARVTADAKGVHVRPNGPFILWSLSGTITIPWRAIRLAWVEANPERPRGLRFPGASVPGLIIAGTYVRNDGREFWCWKPGTDALVIETDDFHWVNLVVGVDDAAHTAQVLNRGAPTS